MRLTGREPGHAGRVDSMRGLLHSKVVGNIGGEDIVKPVHRHCKDDRAPQMNRVLTLRERFYHT